MVIHTYHQKYCLLSLLACLTTTQMMPSPGISAVLKVPWKQKFSSCGRMLQLSPFQSFLFRALIFSLGDFSQHLEHFSGVSRNLFCALKRLLKNQAWELEAITHYKSSKYRIQNKPTWYHSSPLLFCCATISPSHFNAALKATLNCCAI